MKYVKALVVGVCMVIISSLTGWLLYGYLFLTKTMIIQHLCRPMDSMIWKVGMPVASMVYGFIVAVLYPVLYKSIPGKGLVKGIMYGVILWLVGRFTGEIYWYVTSPEPKSIMVIGWIHGLFNILPLGLIIAALYNKSLENQT